MSRDEKGTKIFAFCTSYQFVLISLTSLFLGRPATRTIKPDPDRIRLCVLPAIDESTFAPLRMKHLSLIISIIALAGVIVLFVRTGSDGRPQRSDAAESPAAHEESEHEEEVEIAIVMGRIQRFHQKFWLAMRANNPELTQFYLHEMEEAMEEIAEGNVVDDGIDISAHMRAYGLKVNEHLQQKLKNEGIAGLEKESESLVDACNACHKASGYDLIKIQVPDGPQAFPDQVMLP